MVSIYLKCAQTYTAIQYMCYCGYTYLYYVCKEGKPWNLLARCCQELSATHAAGRYCPLHRAVSGYLPLRVVSFELLFNPRLWLWSKYNWNKRVISCIIVGLRMFDCGFGFFFNIFDVCSYIYIWCLMSFDVSIFGVWYVSISIAHPPPTVVRFYL